VFHIVFNFLAFSEDIQFWNSRPTMAGISVQSIVIHGVSRIIVLLYLTDQDTSTLVTIMIGLTLLLDLWKISKMFEPIQTYPYFQLISSYRGETMDFDLQSSKYLGMAMVPIVLGYGGYALWFSKFRSFYSFLLEILAGVTYAFGFLAMLPQVYINYRLKTVAGMSGSALVFKFLNTFIDDLLSFMMKMPTMHRVACFRDDFVFFIWLWQRHIYPEDPTRVNEFGESFGEAAESAKKDEGEAPGAVSRKEDEAEITHRGVGVSGTEGAEAEGEKETVDTEKEKETED
jgi:hypothetical protein